MYDHPENKKFYEVPAFERCYYWFALGVIILMSSGILTAARYNLWSKQSEPIPLNLAVIYVIIGLMAFALYSWWYWTAQAPYRVHKVKWNDETLALTPQRGDTIILRWSDITHVGVPAYSGPESAKAAHFHRVRLQTTRSHQAYLIPTSFSDSCMELISVLKHNVER